VVSRPRRTESFGSDNAPGAFQRSDHEIALRSELTRLGKLRQELMDWDVAQSLANGIMRDRQSQMQTDRVAPKAIIQKEQQAINDHEAARRLGGVAVVNASTGHARRLANQDTSAITQLPHLTQLTGAVSAPARSSQQASTHTQTTMPKLTPGPAYSQGRVPQPILENGINLMFSLPASSLSNTAVTPNALGGIPTNSGKSEVCSV